VVLVLLVLRLEAAVVGVGLGMQLMGLTQRVVPAGLHLWAAEAVGQEIPLALFRGLPGRNQEVEEPEVEIPAVRLQWGQQEVLA